MATEAAQKVFAGPPQYATDERELYEPRKDPYQFQNQHDIVDPALIAQLQAQLDALRSEPEKNALRRGDRSWSDRRGSMAA